jgi:hypothetical protein
MTKPTLIINSLPKPVFRLEYFDSADVSNEGLYYVLENVDEYKECIADDPSLKFCITLASKTTPTTNHKILTQDDIANANGEVKTRVKNLGTNETGDIVYSSALLTSTSTRYANSPV